jgi:protein gp37
MRKNGTVSREAELPGVDLERNALRVRVTSGSAARWVLRRSVTVNKTPIEWTDFTVNPFRFRNLETGKVGHHCTKISPGCKNCYSGKMQTGPYLSGLDFIAENKPKGEFFLDENALQQVLRRRKPARIFWCDMTDMFLEDYPDEWIDRCFAVMALTPHLTHQVLTKRADRLLHVMTKVIRTQKFWPLPNVWLGVSVEDQQRADERIPLLLQTPAAVRFLSVEPLLGPVDLDSERVDGAHALGCGDDTCRTKHRGTCRGVDWVIVGGESGPGARPCDVAQVRAIVQRCKAAGVPVFVKQLGRIPFTQHIVHSATSEEWICLNLKDRKGGNPEEWPADLRVRETPSTGPAQPPAGGGASNSSNPGASL